jgi:hypothetical protein
MKKEMIQKLTIYKLINMKRYLLIIAMLLGAVSSWGQVANDQAAVLQKIIDLPDLQQYYPKGPDQNQEQVYVVQLPYAFQANIQLTKFGKPVKFLDSAKPLDKQTVAYFQFESLTFSGNTATAKFVFYYTYIRTQASFLGTVTLNKTGENWIITDTKLNGR